MTESPTKTTTAATGTRMAPAGPAPLGSRPGGPTGRTRVHQRHARRRRPSQTLREAATAVFAAWGASADRAGVEEAIGALRTGLAGKAPRQLRQPGAPGKPREGAKPEAVLTLLRRPEGATVGQIAEATGWQHHTVGGSLQG